eukprot:UN04757
MKIQGEVIKFYTTKWLLRQQTKLKTYLQNKITDDVASKHIIIQIKFMPAGSSTTYNDIVQQFKAYIQQTAAAEDVAKFNAKDNILEVYARSTIIGELRARATDQNQTPLSPGSIISLTTYGSTPFVDTITIEKEVAIDRNRFAQKYDEKKDQETQAGIAAFAARYQAMDARREAAAPTKKDDDDDDWD